MVDVENLGDVPSVSVTVAESAITGFRTRLLKVVSHVARYFDLSYGISLKSMAVVRLGIINTL